MGRYQIFSNAIMCDKLLIWENEFLGTSCECKIACYMYSLLYLYILNRYTFFPSDALFPKYVPSAIHRQSRNLFATIWKIRYYYEFVIFATYCVLSQSWPTLPIQ